MMDKDKMFKTVELLVSAQFGISEHTISDLNKIDRAHFEARAFVYLIMSYLFGLHWTEIAEYYKRPRRSVFHGIRSAYNLISYSPLCRCRWISLRDTLRTMYPNLDIEPPPEEKKPTEIRLEAWHEVLGI